MRIRSIKPEYWRSDDIDALDIPDRLLFIGLWSYVDDSGVGLDRPPSITADLFAGDLSREPHETSVRVQGGLNRLNRAGLIVRFEVAGRDYVKITNWDLHQKINRPTPSRYPQPTSDDAKIHSPLTESSVRVQEDFPFGTGEQGNRGAGEQWSSSGSVSDQVTEREGKVDHGSGDQQTRARTTNGIKPHGSPRLAQLNANVHTGRAFTLVAQFASGKPGRKILTDTRSQLGERVQGMLNDDCTEAHILASLEAWMETGYGPSLLPQVASNLLNGVDSKARATGTNANGKGVAFTNYEDQSVYDTGIRPPAKDSR